MKRLAVVKPMRIRLREIDGGAPPKRLGSAHDLDRLPFRGGIR
jgi:hypothetical protein